MRLILAGLLYVKRDKNTPKNGSFANYIIYNGENAKNSLKLLHCEKKRDIIYKNIMESLSMCLLYLLM